VKSQRDCGEPCGVRGSESRLEVGVRFVLVREASDLIDGLRCIACIGRSPQNLLEPLHVDGSVLLHYGGVRLIPFLLDLTSSGEQSVGSGFPFLLLLARFPVPPLIRCFECVTTPALDNFFLLSVVESLEHYINARFAALATHRQGVLDRVYASIQGPAFLSEVLSKCPVSA